MLLKSNLFTHEVCLMLLLIIAGFSISYMLFKNKTYTINRKGQLEPAKDILFCSYLMLVYFLVWLGFLCVYISNNETIPL